MKTKLFFTFFLIIALLVVGCGTKEQSQEQTGEGLAAGAEEEIAVETGEETTQAEPGEETVPPVLEEETVAEEVLNESIEVSSEEGVEPAEEAALVSEEASETVPVEETLEANYVVITVEGCTDTDGGMNYELAGTVTDVNSITDEDYCSTNENYPGRLYETYCRESGKHGREQYDCLSKVCKLGACAPMEASETTGS